MKRLGFVSLFFAFAATLLAQGDPAVIAKILDEGKSRNQVMKHLTYLSEKIGARLTGSPNLQKAFDWTKSQFESFGLTCTLEKWGEIPVGFQRGARQIGRMISPVERDFEFTSRSWTPGTNGPVRGKAVIEPSTLEALNLVKGSLKGAWVLTRPRARGQQADQAVADQINKAIDAAGIAGRVSASTNELVITGGSYRNLTMDNLPKSINVTIRKSDREAIVSQMAAGKEVTLEFDMDNKFIPGPVPVYNVVAEIKGTEKPDEVVIVSGHLDSWDGPGSQGTCDNGTGTMVTVETARILSAVGAKPKRTIRFILWSGEEQGLLGSRAYVEKHKDEIDKISAVLVDDGGTDYDGGLVCIAAMEPMLKQAVEPVANFFPDMPVQIRTADRMPRGGGSDHASFNAVGVPGFFWDERGRANYGFVHHTQHDRLDQAIPEYLVQSSTVSAVTAYNLACADTLLPRQKTGN